MGGGGGFCEQQVLLDYGVGIDCHSKFLAICVLCLRGGRVWRAERECGVDWPSPLEAKEWITKTLGSLLQGPLRYCIESTGTYHMPVLRAFGGEPSVVNPLLAGPTRRKTNTLDARLLAHHSITGLWPKSFIPSEDGLQLRVLWAQRGEAVRAATRASNRANNIILRFGHTIAAEEPIRSTMGRALVDALVEGEVPGSPHVAPGGLPAYVRPVVGKLMADLTRETLAAREATKAARAFVEAREWPTADGLCPGAKLLRLLQTVPGVGETTSMCWLSEVCDPKRFQTAEQVAAFTGCDPSLKVSAGKVTEHVRRKGNDRLHRALLFAAQAKLRHADSRLALWGQAIAGRHRKGGHRKAIGAMSRRIACGLWHVHRLGQEFCMDNYHFGKPPGVRDAPREAIGLTPAQLASLPSEIATAQDVVNSFWKGQLGALRGFGQQSLEKISVWIDSNRAARAGPRIYRLDKNKKYERREKKRPDAPWPPHRQGDNERARDHA